MPGPYKKKKHHTGDTFYKRKYRTRHRQKDLDEIDEDLKSENAELLLNQPLDSDKPGEGQFYCLHCARYFIDDFTLNQHFKTKAHKKRLKDLETEPYTIEESERAAGYVRPAVEAMRHFHAKNELIVSHLRHFFMCDVERELDHIPALEKRFEERRCKPPIDLYDLKELYALLRRQTAYHVSLQASLLEIDSSHVGVDGKKKPAVLKAVDQMEQKELKKYYLLQQINDSEKCYLRLRNYVLYHCFSFPNELHADTPRDDTDRIIWSNVSDEVIGLDHLEVGHRLGVLEYSSPERYYLLNEAANIEMALQRYVSHLLSDDLNFKPFRNPDTCHDFLMEGTYLDGSENEGFVLENSRYRLTGGASFPSFCAYKAGSSSHAKFMPEKFFTCGRRYVPPTNDVDKGLYTVRQRSNIQAFIATCSEEEIQTEYARMLEWLITLYERLGVHFRVCNTRASALHRSESLRASIQLYSAHRREFVDAAHVSFSGDYISQRLNIVNHDKDENYYTTWLLDVAVLSVPILTANLLEKSKTTIFIPQCLVPYMHKTS